MTSMPSISKSVTSSSSSSFESIMYFFHHKNNPKLSHKNFNLKSIQHSSQLLAIDWQTLQFESQKQQSISSSLENPSQKQIESNSDSIKENISLICNHERGLKWDNAYFFKKLNTKWLSQTFSFCDTLSSTQTFLKSNASYLPSGTLCTCNTQTCGKGRGGNTWKSPKGCLMFSFTADLNSSKVRFLPALQYLISIAVVEAILQLTDNQLQLQLKWPNDIYFNDSQKIGGILCESFYLQTYKKYRVIAGIGLNVDNELPTTCISRIVNDMNEKENETHKLINVSNINREDILSTFCNIFESMFDDFCIQGLLESHRQKYLQYWMHSQQKVTVVESENSMKSKEMTIIGISKYGLLLAENSAGETFELHPNGNSFDFLNGLICRKIQNA